MKDHKTVDHPAHYMSSGGIECIDYIDALGFGDGFELGNVIKYIARAGRKGDPVEDLKKADWYLRRCIARLEAETK